MTRAASRTRITVRARGDGLDVTLRFDVASAVTTRMAQGPLANDVDFLQLRGRYTVSGRAAGAARSTSRRPGQPKRFAERVTPRRPRRF